MSICVPTYPLIRFLVRLEKRKEIKGSTLLTFLYNNVGLIIPTPKRTLVSKRGDR